MKNFIYYSPTKIFFGKDEEKKIGEILLSYHACNVLFVYGKSSIKNNGLYDIIVNAMRNSGINYFELSGVEPNPDVTLCRIGQRMVVEHKIDFILAVGGGSVIDTAKNIACSYEGTFDPWLLNNHSVTPSSALPIGCILTIAAAGSELSNSCVISNKALKIKNGFNFDGMRPTFAVMNPELTYSVSPFQTACGIVDIIMHTLERYLNEVDDAYLTDSFAVGLIKTVIASGKVVMQNPYDYEARAALMLASSFSHNGLTGMGETMYFTVHKLEHKLSGDFDSIAHGAGLSILYPAWAKYVNSNLPHRFATIARLVFDVKEENDEQAGLIGTQMFKDFFVSLGLPVSLSEVGVGCELFNKMALELTKNDSVLVPGFKKLHADDVEKIFYLAK